VKTVNDKLVMAFIGLSIHAIMIGGGRPFLRENLTDTDPYPLKNSDFQSIFARSASAGNT